MKSLLYFYGNKGQAYPLKIYFFKTVPNWLIFQVRNIQKNTDDWESPPFVKFVHNIFLSIKVYTGFLKYIFIITHNYTYIPLNTCTDTAYDATSDNEQV